MADEHFVRWVPRPGAAQVVLAVPSKVHPEVLLNHIRERLFPGVKVQTHLRLCGRCVAARPCSWPKCLDAPA